MRILTPNPRGCPRVSQSCAYLRVFILLLRYPGILVMWPGRGVVRVYENDLPCAWWSVVFCSDSRALTDFESMFGCTVE